MESPEVTEVINLLKKNLKLSIRTRTSPLCNDIIETKIVIKYNDEDICEDTFLMTR